jgi:hypothetical protein
VAFVLLAAQWTAARVDDIYRAGDFCGRPLYWVPLAALALDTVGWERWPGAVWSGGRDTVTRRDSLAGRLAANGQAMYRLTDVSAMSVALLIDQGYRVFVLSQWHASLGHKVMLPKPGMPLEEQRHNLVSDFVWEEIEGAALEKPAGTRNDYGVRLSFAGAGHVEYDGRDLPARKNRQMLGTLGFSVRVPEVQYSEDLNVRRTIFGVYVLAESAKKSRDVVRDIETAMDRLKLDLSYGVPKVSAVKAEGRGK